MTTKIILNKEITETLFESLDEDVRYELAQSAISGTIGKYIKKVIPEERLHAIEREVTKQILADIEDSIATITTKWLNYKYENIVKHKGTQIESRKVFEAVVADYREKIRKELHDAFSEYRTEYRKKVDGYVDQKLEGVEATIKHRIDAIVNEEYANKIRAFIREELREILKNMGD